MREYEVIVDCRVRDRSGNPIVPGFGTIDCNE